MVNILLAQAGKVRKKKNSYEMRNEEHLKRSVGEEACSSPKKLKKKTKKDFAENKRSRGKKSFKRTHEEECYSYRKFRTGAFARTEGK